MSKPSSEFPNLSFMQKEIRSNMPRIRIVVGLLCIGTQLCMPATAQENYPSTTFHVESQLVVLDVVVTDAKGNTVTNLGREDFMVYENGVLQEIRNFDPPQGGGSMPAVPPKDRSGRDDWGNAPLSIIVLDALDTPFDEMAYSRNQLDHYLKAQPSLLPRPTIVLWLSDSGIKKLTPFTRNRDEILTEVDSQKGVSPDKFIRGAEVEQLSEALEALQQVTLFSRGSKGAKQIIWIGRSFPGVSGVNFDKAQLDLLHRAVTSTIDLLLRSRATIYAIDPTLTVAPQTNTISEVAGPATVSEFSSQDPFASSFSFYTLVQQSGGKYFYGYNDLNNEIADSIAQSASVYTLGYVPSSPIQDGIYRTIQVRVNNPQLHVQTRQGYYSSAPSQAPSNANNRLFELREALVARMDYNGIGVRIDHCQLDANRITAGCDIVLDNRTLTLGDTEGGQERASVIAVIGAIGAKSLLLSNRVFEMGLGVTDRAVQGGFTTIQLHLQLPRNTQILRIAIQDASGRIGTANLDSTRVKQLIAASPISKTK